MHPDSGCMRSVCASWHRPYRSYRLSLETSMDFIGSRGTLSGFIGFGRTLQVSIGTTEYASRFLDDGNTLESIDATRCQPGSKEQSGEVHERALSSVCVAIFSWLAMAPVDPLSSKLGIDNPWRKLGSLRAFQSFQSGTVCSDCRKRYSAAAWTEYCISCGLFSVIIKHRAFRFTADKNLLTVQSQT